MEELETGLPDCPEQLIDHRGYPRFGKYQGELPKIDLHRLRGPYRVSLPWRLFKHKRWHYAMVATPEVLAMFAIANLTYTASAFACAVDLSSRAVLFDEGYLGFGPLVQVGNRAGEGALAKFRSRRANFWWERRTGEAAYRFGLSARSKAVGPPGLDCDGQLLSSGSSSPLSVVAPVADGGVVNFTQKWAGLEASGSLSAGGRTYPLDHAVGGFDYTHGLLARRTAWKWAFANGRLKDGRMLGLNLAEGFNERGASLNENALWVGGRLIPLSRAQFTFNPLRPLEEWSLGTDDGVVDLRFHPIHVHREERDYKVVRSDFLQPLGVFEGRLTVDREVHRISQLPGVTERQDVVW